MAFLVLALFALSGVSVLLARLAAADGYGTRPGPRSHDTGSRPLPMPHDEPRRSVR